MNTSGLSRHTFQPVHAPIDEEKCSAEFTALSTLESDGVKCLIPANQKLGCCCFRVNYAILPHARSLLSNMACKLEEKDPMNAVGNGGRIKMAADKDAIMCC